MSVESSFVVEVVGRIDKAADKVEIERTIQKALEHSGSVIVGRIDCLSWQTQHWPEDET